MAPFDAAAPIKKRNMPCYSLESAMDEEREAVLELLGQGRRGSGSDKSLSDIYTSAPPAPIGTKPSASADTGPFSRAGPGIYGQQDPVAAFSIPPQTLSTPASRSGSRSAVKVETKRRYSSPGPTKNQAQPPRSSIPDVSNFDKAYRRLSNRALDSLGSDIQDQDMIESDVVTKDFDSSYAIESETSTSDDESDESDKDDESDTSPSSSPAASTTIRPIRSLSSAIENERIELVSQLSDLARTRKYPPVTTQVMGSQSPKVRFTEHSSVGFHKPQIHPNTNYDIGSRSNTPYGSDTEQTADAVKHAEAISIRLSDVQSVGLRTIKTLTRGAFEEAEADAKRLRTYLVSTDSSMESVYALEWGIGTMLRSGDTMYVVQAIERTPEHTDLVTMTYERSTAIEEILSPLIRFLKRTRLQVHIIVEVIHHKVPKHLVTEMIDYIEPTLVIIGSRGKTALKSVLLGSFSNYLVAKSSVPVMVVRRKLKKVKQHRGREDLRMIRMANNLLAQAKID